ncbi:MAG: hypothetical protein KGZ96_05160 [Clostridia bacterium]|nr:hypothetical protein [Clostridia bacterium]
MPHILHANLFYQGPIKQLKVLQRLAHPERLLSAGGCYIDPALFAGQIVSLTKCCIYLTGNVCGRDMQEKNPELRLQIYPNIWRSYLKPQSRKSSGWPLTYRERAAS